MAVQTDYPWKTWYSGNHIFVLFISFRFGITPVFTGAEFTAKTYVNLNRWIGPSVTGSPVMHMTPTLVWDSMAHPKLSSVDDNLG